MDKLITALAPVFAAAFSVQQLLEILTSVLDLDSRSNFQKYKKTILGVVSLIVGFVLAYNGYLRVLQPLFIVNSVTDPTTHAVTPIYSVAIPRYLDFIVTGLVISAGTEGLNSIMKFMKYAKEDKKNEAAAKTPANANAPHSASVPVATAAALAEINQK
jgi:uncharacterized membrane protein YidH (DUF202 family)